MISGVRTTINAAECTDRAGKHAFGLNENKAVTALRKLADDIEAGIDDVVTGGRRARSS